MTEFQANIIVWILTIIFLGTIALGFGIFISVVYLIFSYLTGVTL